MKDCSTSESGAHVWRSARELIASGAAYEAPAVLLLDGATPEDPVEVGALPDHVVVVAADAAAVERLSDRVDISMVGASDETRDRVLDVACRLASSRLSTAQLSKRLDWADHEAHELAHVSSKLMLEH